MSLYRIGSRLAAWVFVLWAASAWAQPPEGQAIGDLQLFANGQPSTYGGGPRANEGLFFTYNGLYMTMSAPQTTTIGVPGGSRAVFWGTNDLASATQGNTMDTGFMRTDFSGGSDIMLGFIRDHEGINFHYFDLHGVSQQLTQPDTQVFYNDATWGSGGFFHLEGALNGPTVIGFLPVEYDMATVHDMAKIYGIDANYIYRQHPTFGGGIFEWYLGARYIEFRELFTFDATGGVLGNTDLSNDSYNRMVGPQIGLRYFHRMDRWTFSTFASFVPAADFQTTRQVTQIGSDLGNAFGDRTSPPIGPLPRSLGTPLAMRAMTSNDVLHATQFSPIVEMRVELKYQLTLGLAANVGWEGMWVDNVARPSNMVDYSLRETRVMGILNNNRQQLFMNGLRAGLEFNY